MSTGDALVHAAASVAVRDGYKALVRPDLGAAEETRLIRWMVVVIAAFAYYFAVVSDVSLVALLLLSYGFVAQIAPLTAATFLWRRASRAGAIAGFSAGCATVVGLNVWPELQWFGVHPGIWGLGVNVAVFAVVSALTSPPPAEHVEPFVSA
jgi:SSS family solute:Na+ symporter